MRIQYHQSAGGGRSGANVVIIDWRQEWFTNLCLSVILAVILFLMLLSIYMVFTKPAPVSAPSPTQTGAVVGGSAFAMNHSNTESPQRNVIDQNTETEGSPESIGKAIS